jgi:predicted CopG family antitoxin
MAKAELKTKKTAASVSDFIASMPDASRKRDCTRVLNLMKSATETSIRDLLRKK